MEDTPAAPPPYEGPSVFLDTEDIIKVFFAADTKEEISGVNEIINSVDLQKGENNIVIEDIEKDIESVLEPPVTKNELSKDPPRDVRIILVPIKDALNVPERYKRQRLPYDGNTYEETFVEETDGKSIYDNKITSFDAPIDPNTEDDVTDLIFPTTKNANAESGTKNEFWPIRKINPPSLKTQDLTLQTQTTSNSLESLSEGPVKKQFGVSEPVRKQFGVPEPVKKEFGVPEPVRKVYRSQTGLRSQRLRYGERTSPRIEDYNIISVWSLIFHIIRYYIT
jgi:hypothetical protein